MSQALPIKLPSISKLLKFIHSVQQWTLHLRIIIFLLSLLFQPSVYFSFAKLVVQILPTIFKRFPNRESLYLTSILRAPRIWSTPPPNLKVGSKTFMFLVELEILLHLLQHLSSFRGILSSNINKVFKICCHSFFNKTFLVQYSGLCVFHVWRSDIISFA